MNSSIIIKSEIENSSGKSIANPVESFNIRVWLEMTVNGKTAMSRGTVITVEQPSLADARQLARRIAAHAQEQIAGMDAKAANSALAAIVNEAVERDAQADAIYTHRNGEKQQPTVPGYYRMQFRDGSATEGWLDDSSLVTSYDSEYPRYYGPIPHPQEA
jgi:hypothetical protein